MSLDVKALYAASRQDAFRLETRQSYDVPVEDAQLRAWKAGRPIPRDPEIEADVAVYSSLVRAGVPVRRVHVIDLPLTSYLRFEMAAYQADNIRGGEQVLIAVRPWHPALARLTDDFFLFDGDTPRAAVVWMRYNDAGQVTSRELSTSPADIARCREHRDLALACAVPLIEFTALPEAV